VPHWFAGRTVADLRVSFSYLPKLAYYARYSAFEVVPPQWRIHIHTKMARTADLYGCETWKRKERRL